MGETDRISFLGFRCPENFQLRTLTLYPNDAVDYHRADWLGALVVVERGELELECRSGVRARFTEGAVIVLSGLPLRRLRNSGSVPLLISAIARTLR